MLFMNAVLHDLSIDEDTVAMLSENQLDGFALSRVAIAWWPLVDRAMILG